MQPLGTGALRGGGGVGAGISRGSRPGCLGTWATSHAPPRAVLAEMDQQAPPRSSPPPPAALWLRPGPEPRTPSAGDTQAAAGAPGTGGHRPLALMRGPRAAPAAARGASRGISWGTHTAREAAPPPAGTSRSIRLFSTFIITNLMLFFFFLERVTLTSVYVALRRLIFNVLIYFV